MKIEIDWERKMRFHGGNGTHEVQMDTTAPIGESSALSPKQLLLAAISGCTAMDVVSLLQKEKQTIQKLHVSAEGEQTDTHPRIFKSLHLEFDVQGEIDALILEKVVVLSQTKYCGVSAMVAKSVPIDYVVRLNGSQITVGKAAFPN